MDFFDLFSRYLWLVCIAVATVNYLLAGRPGKSAGIGDAPQLRKYRGWLFVLSIVPWLVVGYAQIIGEVPTIWWYFRPQDGNPYVWAFYSVVLLDCTIGAYWILFCDGARIAAELGLVKYHVFGKSSAMGAFWIKVFAVAAFPFFAFWLWFMSRMNVPIP